MKKKFKCAVSEKKDSSSKEKVLWIGSTKASAEQFMDFLKDFIDDYVLCKTCGLPETDMKIYPEKVKTGCNSCGSLEVVNKSNRYYFLTKF